MEKAPCLAFLTMQSEGITTIGALLVTNHWGRPLEFHVTQPIQPTKLQQILYGPTLKLYLCSDLLARALLEKVENPLSLVVTDIPEALHCCTHAQAPVVCLSAGPSEETIANTALVWQQHNYRLYTVRNDTESLNEIREVLQQLQEFDLSEPFDRIREAIRESRRLGVIARAA